MIELKGFQGEKAVRDALTLLAMSRDTRRQIFKDAADRTRNEARSNTKNQSTVDGQRMAPRKKGRAPVLQNIAKKKNMRVLAISDTGVVIGWRGAMGLVAAKHQHGHVEKSLRGDFLKEQEAKRRKRKATERKNGSEDATLAQAKALQAEGFRQRVGNRRVRRSTKWIQNNLSQNQAGAMLRYMREELGSGENKGLASWDIVYPARPFAHIDADALISDTQKAMFAN